jgi:hypothetical protein
MPSWRGQDAGLFRLDTSGLGEPTKGVRRRRASRSHREVRPGRMNLLASTGASPTTTLTSIHSASASSRLENRQS